MNKNTSSLLTRLTLAALMAAVPATYAQTTPGKFTTEPNKSLAEAHESFVKKDLSASAEQIHKAADYVKKQSDKVAEDSKEGVSSFMERRQPSWQGW